MATRTWIGTTSGDWSVTTNWVEGSVPANGDDVVFKNNAVDVSSGLAQSAVTVATLTIDSTYTGKIGTASAYLQLGATAVSIGGASGSATPGTGSQRIKINFGTVQMTTTVYSTCSSSADTGIEPVQIIGTHASNKLYVQGGRVGVATVITSAVATISEWDITGSSAVLNLGVGCTLTTGYQTAGTVNINSAIATFTQTGGTATTTGAGAISTAASIGGTAYLNSTGTIAICNLYGTGRADFSQNPAARTVTVLNHFKGGSLVLHAANPAHLTISTYNKLQGGTLTLS
jgi:hypothetical protein